MSGRNSNSRKNPVNDLEGSHPQELNAQHRYFLVRSLGRNDTDLAALLQVNASLTKLKQQLLEACGELVLLDLGSGRLSLLQEELHFHHNPPPPPPPPRTATPQPPQDGVEYTLPPAQSQLCVDFLLRMKLRRKLANRLIRRLNRVAHAMDGMDVSPPPPPRYGDLRLHVTPHALKDFTHHQDRLKAAREYVERATTTEQVEAEAATTTTTSAEEEQDEKEVDEKDEMTLLAEPSHVQSAKDEPMEVEKEEAAKESNDVVETEAQAEAAAAATAATKEEDDVTPTPAAGTEADTPAVAKEEVAEPVPSLSAPHDAHKEPEAVDGMPPTETMGPTSLQEAYEILKEYEDAYSKVWDEETHSWKYVLLANQEASSSSTANGTPPATVVPDYQAITAGAAIGATARLLSLQEREQEFKRWQSSILARIPDQPTFEQLGLKNRVFMLEQRRKRCLEDIEGDGTTKEAKKKRVEEGDEANDESEAEGEEVKDEEVKDEEVKDEEEVDKPKKIQLAPRKKKEDEEDEEHAATKEEDEAPEGLKIIKPMSLAAVPSFHDQDLNRIRAVHGDLMGVSLMEGSRQSLTEATNQYNAAHYRSNQLFDHRTRLQQNLSFFIQKSRADLAKVSGEHGLQVALAKQQWIKQKMEHDQKRVKQFLPSAWGRPVFGTNATQQYQQRGGIQATVAGCLADIVDGTLIMLEGKVANHKFAPFQAPPPHANQTAGDSMQQQIARSENEFRLQLEQTNTQFQQSEEARQRAWTKMMKIKAELETLSGGAGRQGYLDLNNYHRIPLPPLRNSQLQQMPQEYVSRSNVASFTPPPVPGTSSGSVSKYSAAKVRERMSNDGSVAPVAEPKKDKDGLFIRPAGRTRKGMKWDAVQGIWVPE